MLKQTVLVDDINVTTKIRSSNPRDSKTQKVLSQVDEVKGIMHNNMNAMLANHEKVEILQDKSGILQHMHAVDVDFGVGDDIVTRIQPDFGSCRSHTFLIVH